MSKEFMSFDTVKDDLPEIVPIFINAFAGDPWYEVSKCVDDQVLQRCKNGLSSVALGALCGTCLKRPERPAYDFNEVMADFEDDNNTAETVWYVERVMSRIALAGYASLKSTEQFMQSTYRRSPDAKPWLENVTSGQNVVWLHELFADTSVRATGNLKNFREMGEGMMDYFDVPVLAYCTINPRMVAAAERHFEGNVDIYRGNSDSPDHRDFVLINLK